MSWDNGAFGRFPWVNGTAGGVALSPAQLGAFLWTNARTSITLTGSTVDSWPDLSGNGYHLIPGATGGGGTVGAPSYDATGLIGQPTVNFSGSGKGLTRIGLGGSTRSAFSFYMVMQSGAADTEDALWYAPNNSDWSLETSGTYLQQPIASANQSVGYYVQGTGEKANTPAGALLTGRPQVLTGTYDGTTLSLYLNNVLMSSAAQSGAHIGDRIAIATLLPAYATFDSNIKISELAFFPTALNTSQRAALHSYAKTQWFSSLWAGNRSSMRFDGSTSNFSGGVQSVLNYAKANRLIFSKWFRYRSGSTQKGSFFCREDVNGPSYKGWDDFVYSDGKQGWYAANAFDSGDYLLTYGPQLPNDGKLFVHVVLETVNGTNAGTRMWYNGVEQTVSAAHDGLVGDMTSTTNTYFMGDAQLDGGHDYLDGDLSDCAIIVGQTCSDSFISTYLAPNKYPCNLSTCPGIEHWWQFGASDTVNLIHDQIGSITLTTVGPGGVLISETPLP